MKKYCNSLGRYERRASCRVRIGNVEIGGGAPVSVQSMTNTDTNDTAASVAQIERIDRAGGPIVRLTAQGPREGENLRNIVAQLRAEGFSTAIVADIHFVPEVAEIAAESVDKVRINPGNIGAPERVRAVADACRDRGVPIRIGVNTGSIEKDILAKYGCTGSLGAVTLLAVAAAAIALTKKKE